MSEGNNSSSGMGITGTIIVVLIVLKLIGVEPVVGWSWASIIFLPMLIGLGIGITFIAGIFLIALLFSGGSKAASGATRAHGKRHMNKLNAMVDAMEDSDEASRNP